MRNFVISLLLLIPLMGFGQQQTAPETKQCKAATNAADALNNFDWMNNRIDTAKQKQDSVMYELRIAKMKLEIEERNAKKPH